MFNERTTLNVALCVTMALALTAGLALAGSTVLTFEQDEEGFTGDGYRTTDAAYNGSYSYLVPSSPNGNCNGGVSVKENVSHEGGGFNLTFWRYDTGTEVSNEQSNFVLKNSSNGKYVELNDEVGESSFAETFNLDNDISQNEWQKWEIRHRPSNNSLYYQMGPYSEWVNTTGAGFSSTGDGLSIKIETEDYTNTCDSNVRAYYDDIDLGLGNQTGDTTATDSKNLRLDVKNYMPHGSQQDYAVKENQSGTWVDVTDESTVYSSNTSVVTVDQSNNTLHATENESVNQMVNVTAEKDSLAATENVTVANSTVNNLNILPGWWRLNATFNDSNIRVLIVAIMGAVVATRHASGFAGVGAMTLVMVLGWVGGYAGTGIMLITVMMGLFLGLNLALNIDTTVRQ